MKKNFSKLLSSLLIIASVASTTTSIYAEYRPEPVDSTIQSTKLIDLKNTITIGTTTLENAKTILENNTIMFPAREVFENMGYTVEWNGIENPIIVSKLPHYITFTIGIDGYTFAKTAPMKLNVAPKLINGVTYVPITLLSEIMNINTETDENNNIYIKLSSDNEEEKEATAKVTSIENDSIYVDDTEKGEVVLVPNDETEILFKDNTSAKFEDISVSDKLFVEYGDAMTMSIPPINNPKKIIIEK